MCHHCLLLSPLGMHIHSSVNVLSSGQSHDQACLHYSTNYRDSHKVYSLVYRLWTSGNASTTGFTNVLCRVICWHQVIPINISCLIRPQSFRCFSFFTVFLHLLKEMYLSHMEAPKTTANLNNFYCYCHFHWMWIWLLTALRPDLFTLNRFPLTFCRARWIKVMAMCDIFKIIG